MTRPRNAAALALGLALGLAMLAGCANDRHAERMSAAGPNPTLERLMTVADVDAGARKFGQCAACHSIIEGAIDRDGPNLFGVYGKPFGRNRGRYAYTAAIQGPVGRWDDRTLDAWMVDPQKVVPGTKMQFGGVPDPLDRADIIAFLKTREPAD